MLLGNQSRISSHDSSGGADWCLRSGSLLFGSGGGRAPFEFYPNLWRRLGIRLQGMNRQRMTLYAPMGPVFFADPHVRDDEVSEEVDDNDKRTSILRPFSK